MRNKVTTTRLRVHWPMLLLTLASLILMTHCSAVDDFYSRLNQHPQQQPLSLMQLNTGRLNG